MWSVSWRLSPVLLHQQDKAWMVPKPSLKHSQALSESRVKALTCIKHARYSSWRAWARTTSVCAVPTGTVRPCIALLSRSWSSITCASPFSSALLYRIRKNTTLYHDTTRTFARAMFADRQRRREEVNLGRGNRCRKEDPDHDQERHSQMERARASEELVWQHVWYLAKLCASATQFWAAAVAATTLTSLEPSELLKLLLAANFKRLMSNHVTAERIQQLLIQHMLKENTNWLHAPSSWTRASLSNARQWHGGPRVLNSLLTATPCSSKPVLTVLLLRYV